MSVLFYYLFCKQLTDTFIIQNKYSSPALQRCFPPCASGETNCLLQEIQSDVVTNTRTIWGTWSEASTCHSDNVLVKYSIMSELPLQLHVFCLSLSDIALLITKTGSYRGLDLNLKPLQVILRVNVKCTIGVLKL